MKERFCRQMVRLRLEMKSPERASALLALFFRCYECCCMALVLWLEGSALIFRLLPLTRHFLNAWRQDRLMIPLQILLGRTGHCAWPASGLEFDANCEYGLWLPMPSSPTDHEAIKHCKERKASVISGCEVRCWLVRSQC